MHTGTRLHPVDDADVSALAEMFARAFFDDPIVRHVLPDESTRERHLVPLYALYVRFFRRHGLCHASAACTAAALWAPPGTYPPSLLQHLRLLPGIAHALGLMRVPRALRVLGHLDRVHPFARPHWYLGVLGVEPALQRRGMGHALLAPVLAVCDCDRLGVYLETGNEANLAFYARDGFTVLHEHRLLDGPRFWGLWREPSQDS
jgi:GNAT superfamily N-acetyltransferase